LTTIEEHLAITNRKCFALVSATFILRTSLKNPIPLLPAALTQEKITNAKKYYKVSEPDIIQTNI
jgi:hypothetical protein